MAKRWIWILAVGLLVPLWTGCSDDDDDGEGPLPECKGFTIHKGDGKAAKTMRIGLLLPLTGDSSKSGTQMRDSALMAFEDIKYTIGDYNIEVVEVDSESDSEGKGKAKVNYENAIDKCGLSMGLLNWHSGVSVACMDVAADKKMPHLFAFGATDAVNTKYAKDPKYKVWGTKGWPEPATYVAGYLDAIQAVIEGDTSAIEVDGDPWDGGKKKILLGNEAGAWGKSFIRGARKELTKADGYWKKNGWEIVDTVGLDDTGQYATIVGDAVTKEVSLIIATSTSQDIAGFVTEINKQMTGTVVVLEGLGWSPALGDAGAAANLVLDGGGAAFQDSDVAKNYKAAYKAKAGEDPSPGSGGQAFDFGHFAVKVLQETYKVHSKLDKASIQDINVNKLQTGQLTHGPGAVHKEYKYTADTVPDMVYDLNAYYFPVLQYQDDGTGTIATKTVYPKSLADGKFKTPAAPTP